MAHNKIGGYKNWPPLRKKNISTAFLSNLRELIFKSLYREPSFIESHPNLKFKYV